MNESKLAGTRLCKRDSINVYPLRLFTSSFVYLCLMNWNELVLKACARKYRQEEILRLVFPQWRGFTHEVTVPSFLYNNWLSRLVYAQWRDTSGGTPLVLLPDVFVPRKRLIQWQTCLTGSRFCSAFKGEHVIDKELTRDASHKIKECL